MAPVALEPRPTAVRRTRAAASAACLVVAAIGAFIGLSALVRGPEFVDRLTLENRTGLALSVAVTDHDENALLAVATVSPTRTAVVEDIIDQGDQWVFVLTSAGEPVGRLELTRDELESRDWHVVLPATLANE